MKRGYRRMYVPVQVILMPSSIYEFYGLRSMGSDWSCLVFQQSKRRIPLMNERREHASNRFNHRLLQEYSRNELSSLATASCIWFSCSAPICITSIPETTSVGRQASCVIDPEGQNLRNVGQSKFPFICGEEICSYLVSKPWDI